MCQKKENVVHMLYDCRRVKEIWNQLGKCLKMNIQLKHIILGLTDPHYVEMNRHLIILIVSFTIYSIWCKCSFDKTNYANINLEATVEHAFLFYTDVW